MSGVLNTLAFTIPVIGVIGFIAYVIHSSERGRHVQLRLPHIIPWSSQARLRRMKVEVEIEKVQADLYEAKHHSLQRELVYTELEEKRFDRALGRGNGGTDHGL